MDELLSINADIYAVDRTIDGTVENILGDIRIGRDDIETRLASVYRPMLSDIRRDIRRIETTTSSILTPRDIPPTGRPGTVCTPDILRRVIDDVHKRLPYVPIALITSVSQAFCLVLGDSVLSHIDDIVSAIAKDYDATTPKPEHGTSGLVPTPVTDIDTDVGMPTPPPAPPKPKPTDDSGGDKPYTPTPTPTDTDTCPVPEPEPVCIYPDGSISFGKKPPYTDEDTDKTEEDKTSKEGLPEPSPPSVGIGEDDITRPTPTAPIISPLLPTGTPYCGRDPKRTLDTALLDATKRLTAKDARSTGIDYALGVMSISSSLATGVLSKLGGSEIAGRIKALAPEIGADISLGIDIFTKLYGEGYISGYGSPVVASYYATKYGIARQHAEKTQFPIEYFATADLYMLQYCSPVYIPSQSEIDRAWIYGEISDSTWEAWTRCHGNIPQCRLPILSSQNYRHSPTDIIDLYRRGVIRDTKALVEYMSRSGVRGEQYISEINELRTILPSPSELVHWAIRDVFDPTKLGREEMIREYEQQRGLQEMFDIIGYSDRTYTLPDGRKVEYRPGLYTFMASYEEVSPTQVYEMLHRLRPNRVGMYRIPTADGRFVNPEPVDIHTVRKLLKEKDYNPIWRDRLTAISYRTLGRIELKRIYSVGAFGKPIYTRGFETKDGVPVRVIGIAETELVERFRDYGYTDIDALLLAYQTAYILEGDNSTKLRKKRIKYIRKGYLAGVYGYEQSIGLLVNIGYSKQEASEYVEQWRLDRDTTTITTTIRTLKNMYIRGDIDDDELRSRLVDSGVLVDVVNRYMTEWQYEREYKKRNVTTQLLCQWYVTGQITYDEYMIRLKRIGYSREDAKRIIDTCLAGHAAKSAKEQQRIARMQERERIRRERERIRMERDTQRSEEKRIRIFLSTRTETNLKQWYKENLITYDEVYDTLRMKGYTPEDAKRWIETRDIENNR